MRVYGLLFVWAGWRCCTATVAGILGLTSVGRSARAEVLLSDGWHGWNAAFKRQPSTVSVHARNPIGFSGTDRICHPLPGTVMCVWSVRLVTLTPSIMVASGMIRACAAMLY